jgi:hypothetical protein
VLVTRLANDPDESSTEHVNRALRGEAGFTRLTTCRVVTGHGASDNAKEEGAQAEAERLRVTAGADLVLFGEAVKRPGLHESLYVWMSGPTVRPELRAKPWVVEENGLGPAFREKFNTALQAVVLAALAPAQERSHGVIADRLRPLLPRLSALLDNPPDDLTPKTKATLFSSAARGFQAYGEQTGDKAMLERAITTYGSALSATPRDSEPLDWVIAQNDLGHGTL